MVLVGYGVGGTVGWLVIFGFCWWSSLVSTCLLIIEGISGWDFGGFSGNLLRFGGCFCAKVGFVLVGFKLVGLGALVCVLFTLELLKHSNQP